MKSDAYLPPSLIRRSCCASHSVQTPLSADANANKRKCLNSSSGDGDGDGNGDGGGADDGDYVLSRHLIRL